LVFAGLVGGSGGVANLKTVPIYQGVTDVFLRSSYATDSDEALASFVVADNCRKVLINKLKNLGTILKLSVLKKTLLLSGVIKSIDTALY